MTVTVRRRVLEYYYGCTDGSESRRWRYARRVRSENRSRAPRKLQVRHLLRRRDDATVTRRRHRSNATDAKGQGTYLLLPLLFRVELPSKGKRPTRRGVALLIGNDGEIQLPDQGTDRDHVGPIMLLLLDGVAEERQLF